MRPPFRTSPIQPHALSPHTPDIGPDPDWEEFTPDSPLEGTGFEPSVPLTRERMWIYVVSR
jgi:hypothetical protein